MLAEALSLLLWLAPPAEVVSQPPRQPAPKWRAPLPDEAKTSGGVRVAVLPRAELPLVHLCVVAQVGAELDPDDQGGLAAALSRLMEEGGAGALSGQQLISAIDALGGELEVGTDRGFTYFSLTVLAKHLERALQLLADVVARPRLDDGEWERVKAERLAELLRRRDEPSAAADDLLMRVLFDDPAHAHPVLGTEASVRALTAAQLKAFWARRYGPKTIAVFADGQTTAAQLLGLAEAAFKGWSSQAAPPAVAAPRPSTKRRLVLVDRPFAPQTTVRAAHLGISRTSPDFAAAAVSSVVLGGSFTSRLVQNLREAHGYTYGASAAFKSLRGGGVFQVRTEVRTDVTGAALAEVLREVRGMTAPLSEAEAQKGRALVTAGIVEQLASGLAELAFLEPLAYQLPLDVLSKLPEQMEALTPAALAAAQQRLYRPDELTVVLVGDARLVEPQLKKAVPELGGWERLDLEGKPRP